MASAIASPEARRVSIIEGGPFYHLLLRLHIAMPGGGMRWWLLAIPLWLPVPLGVALYSLVGAPVDPIVFDVSVHVRLLFTLPILLAAERPFDTAYRSAIHSLRVGAFTSRPPIDDIIGRGERLRDSWIVEAVLLGIALVGGQLALWEIYGPTGLVHGDMEPAARSFSRVWYAVVALPLVQFVMFRWLWRWLIWCYMLARISRLPLAVLATHADHAGGLSFLARPVTGFGGFVLATSALLAGAWETQIIEGRATVGEVIPQMALFLLIAFAAGLGPLVLFTGELNRARRRTMAQYGDFVREYTMRFHAKWIDHPPAPAQPLGTPDIQSLNDLGSAFQVISKTRGFVFGMRTVFIIGFTGILPMTPLLVSNLTFEQVLKRIVGFVIGGVPI